MTQNAQSKDAQRAATSMIIGKTDPCRLSYAHLLKPSKMDSDPNAKEKYSVAILIPKNSPELAEIKAKIEEAKNQGAKNLWGGKVPANWKNPLRDGDTEKPDHEEYAGHFFINATSSTKPGIVDGKRNPLTDEALVYSGMYGRVSVNFYPFKKASSGVACGLNNVMKVKDGPALSGRPSAEEDFAGFESEEDDADDVIG